MDINHITTQEILDRISRHCPEAMSAYLICIQRQESGVFTANRNLIEVDLSDSYSKFKNNIKKLALEGLLEWHPKGDSIVVVLPPEEEEFEEVYD